MNNETVEEMKIELDRLNSIAEIQNIITATAVTSSATTTTSNTATTSYCNMSDFNSATLQREYHKIASAREKNYPTYRSEYRVIKTLIRQRNELIYQISRTYPRDVVVQLNTELIKISTLLTATLKSIGEIFEREKMINDLVNSFELMMS